MYIYIYIYINLHALKVFYIYTYIYMYIYIYINVYITYIHLYIYIYYIYIYIYTRVLCCCYMQYMHVFGQCLTQDVRGTILDMICWSFDALGRLSYESMFLCVLYWKKHASLNFYVYIYIVLLYKIFCYCS